MASREYETFYDGVIARPSGAVDPDQPIGEIRRRFEAWLSTFPPDPDVQFEPLQFQLVPILKCSLPSLQSKGAILFFHGGGYNAGSNASHRDLMGRLSRASERPVFGVDYRLAPEHPYPAALEDAEIAYSSLLEEGYSPSQIAFAGSSAGGGLLLALLLHLRQQQHPLPACALCMSPWVDLTQSGRSIRSNDGRDLVRVARLESAAAMYCGSRSRTDPLVSPLYGDLRGLPPLFIQVGNREILLDQIVAFANRAREQKIEVALDIWPEMFHAWQLFAKEIPEGRAAIEKMGRWFKEKSRDSNCFERGDNIG